MSDWLVLKHVFIYKSSVHLDMTSSQFLSDVMESVAYYTSWF